MDKRISLAERLMPLQYWQIAALGGISVLAGMFAVAAAAQLGYGWFPDAWFWVALFHIAGTGAAYWFISRPFIQAYMLRYWLEQVNLRRIRSLVPRSDD